MFVHGVIEYLAGALFIAAPFLFGFDSGAATALSIIAGVLVLIVAATTATATGIIDGIPIAAHVVLDFALAGLLIASPFLFGFSEESAPTAFFIVVGVTLLLVSIGTRYLRPGPERKAV